MEKITTVMGYWSCKFCGTDNIPAYDLEGNKTTCPSCGNPQGEGIRYYLDEKRPTEITPIQSNKIHKAPHWNCEFCKANNKAFDENCSQCGAPQNSSKSDYFGNQPTKVHNIHRSHEAVKFNPPNPPSDNIKVAPSSHESSDLIKTFQSHKKIDYTPILKIASIVIGFMILIFVFIGTVVNLSKPKPILIDEVSWSTKIDIETYNLKNESGWLLPTDATLTSSKKEIYEYENVLSGYENETRTKTIRVQDGYDTEISYTDNGNGTFNRIETRTPKYKNETVTEIVRVPVYKRIPVYRTKYYYTIYRWEYSHSLNCSGTDKSIVWADYKCINPKIERESGRKESFKILYHEPEGTKQSSVSISKKVWENVFAGDEIFIPKICPNLTFEKYCELNQMASSN